MCETVRSSNSFVSQQGDHHTLISKLRCLPPLRPQAKRTWKMIDGQSIDPVSRGLWRAPVWSRRATVGPSMEQPMDVSGERHLSGKSYAFTRGSLTRMAFVWPSTLARAASSSASTSIADWPSDRHSPFSRSTVEVGGMIMLSFKNSLMFRSFNSCR